MDKFKFGEIKKYVQLVEKSDISELEIIGEGVTLRIKKDISGNSSVSNRFDLPVVPNETISIPQSVPQPQIQEVRDLKEVQAESSAKKQLVEIKSPMVGTFYRAPSPDAEPYVQTGDKVKSGQVLCIVEAMKLMNEIESEYSGTIVEICVENGKPVEFEQVLFRIDPA